MLNRIRPVAVLCAVVVSGGLAACSNDATTPEEPSPLEGFSRVQSNDTALANPPQDPPAPGSFHGFVFGLPAPGPGVDSVSQSVALSGVTVAVWQYSGQLGDDGRPVVGERVAVSTTNASGVFQMPDIPGGSYAVSFTPAPPDDAIYVGGWTLTFVHLESNRSPWWIYLPRK